MLSFYSVNNKQIFSPIKKRIDLQGIKSCDKSLSIDESL